MARGFMLQVLSVSLTVLQLEDATEVRNRRSESQSRRQSSNCKLATRPSYQSEKQIPAFLLIFGV